MTKEPKELYNGFLFLRTGDKVDSPLVAYTLNLESVNIDCLEEEFGEKIEALKNGKDVTIKLVCNKAEVVSLERIIEYACGEQKLQELDRAKTLLKATWELLNKQENSGYVLNLLSETVNYDNAECDGNCLMGDINAWFYEFYGEDLECGD